MTGMRREWSAERDEPPLGTHITIREWSLAEWLPMLKAESVGGTTVVHVMLGPVVVASVMGQSRHTDIALEGVAEVLLSAFRPLLVDTLKNGGYDEAGGEWIGQPDPEYDEDEPT